MKVENYIQVRISIVHKALDYRLGKGVKMYLEDVCEPMVLFLVEQFEKNPDCLIGDIRSLYNNKERIDKKRLCEMTYREYLQKEFLIK